MNDAPAPARPRVLLSWPRPDHGNPYVLRLGDALAGRGVVVRPARYLAEHCARPHGARWLHVHWPEWMTRSPSRLRYRARTAWLLGLLDLARAQGVSVAWTAHNLLAHDDPHPDLGERARRAFLARCDVVFGHFASAERDLRALGFRGRFALCPHPHYDADYPRPFADDAARETYRRSLGLDEADTLLVSAGAIEPYKNLVAVARALLDASPSRLRWIVAGRVGHEPTYRSLAALCEGAPWITLRPGFVARDEMARLVAAADASLLAYREFYTSGAAVLSLTLGTPVVGAPLHHLAEYEGETFFAPLRSVDAPALAAAVESVRAMGPSARASARAAALRNGWDHAAFVVDTTLFGGAP